jgi:hypothetical protein
MTDLPPFLKSRKFWALIAGALIIILRTYVPNFPVSDETINQLVLMLVAYIVGTGLEDVGGTSARRALPVTATRVPEPIHRQ